MRGPNLSGFALQWNIGLRIKEDFYFYTFLKITICHPMVVEVEVVDSSEQVHKMSPPGNRKQYLIIKGCRSQKSHSFPMILYYVKL